MILEKHSKCVELQGEYLKKKHVHFMTWSFFWVVEVGENTLVLSFACMCVFLYMNICMG